MPVTEDLNREVKGMVGRPGVEERAAESAERHGFFHWHTAFAEVMAKRGGFDVVLGNPPWERIKLQEKEFFATRSPRIAKARNKAARQRLIDALAREGASRAEKLMHREFHAAKREAEAAGHFMRVSGRFPLTNYGDINTYAVFAETCLDLLNEQGRAGIIVPTGIATDHSTKRFFRAIVANRRLASLRDFENRKGLFKGVHRSYKFCLLTLGSGIERASYVFFATKTAHLRDERREFELTRREIRLLNPNTRTAPVFRSNADARLAKKIYSRVPVLIDEARGEAGNPWGIRFMSMFHMANDSGLFRTYRQMEAAGARLNGGDWTALDGKVWVPLMEAKMIHQYDHRWATYEKDGKTSRLVTAAEKRDCNFMPLPRYWIPKHEVDKKLRAIGWNRNWLIGWRRIARATDERTLIATAFPKSGVGDSIFLMFCSPSISIERLAALVGNLSCLILDFVVRLKIGGTNLNYFLLKQIPVLAPQSYHESDLTYIVPRVFKLLGINQLKIHPTSQLNQHIVHSHILGDSSIIRAQLDAYYASLYGLHIDDIRHLLDPSRIYGKDYPSESFRVLRNRELREFKEYRTEKIIMRSWEQVKMYRAQS